MSLKRYKVDTLYLFFYATIIVRGSDVMFSDEVREKIYNDDECRQVPIKYFITMMSRIEQIIEECEQNYDDEQWNDTLRKL